MFKIIVAKRGAVLEVTHKGNRLKYIHLYVDTLWVFNGIMFGLLTQITRMSQHLRTHAQAHARTSTRTRTDTCTHARTHARTHRYYRKRTTEMSMLEQSTVDCQFASHRAIMYFNLQEVTPLQPKLRSIYKILTQTNKEITSYPSNDIHITGINWTRTWPASNEAS